MRNKTLFYTKSMILSDNKLGSIDEILIRLMPQFHLMNLCKSKKVC